MQEAKKFRSIPMNLDSRIKPIEPQTPQHQTENKSNLEIEIAGGRKKDLYHRENEDQLFLSSNAIAVFDGVGGHRGGADAAKLALNAVAEYLKSIDKVSTIELAREITVGAIKEAHKRIKSARKDGVYEEMSTTGSITFSWKDENKKKKLTFATVGDSKIYLLRKKRLIQISMDDGFSKEKEYNGNITDPKEIRKLQSKLNNIENIKDYEDLTTTEKFLFEHRNIITQSLGKEPLRIRTGTIDIEAGDLLMVCSDGASDNLTDLKMEAILNKNENQTLEVATNKLIDEAFAISQGSSLRAKPDDITVALARFLPNRNTIFEPTQH